MATSHVVWAACMQHGRASLAGLRVGKSPVCPSSAVGPLATGPPASVCWRKGAVVTGLSTDVFSPACRGASCLSDVRAARDQMNIGGLAYPPLPLHEAPPRPPSGYSQAPSVCSSSTSFNGPFGGGVLSPQPHSSYYSGMTGPQHPFYNRVRWSGSPVSLLLLMGLLSF